MKTTEAVVALDTLIATEPDEDPIIPEMGMLRSEFRALASQVCVVLPYLHGQGITHSFVDTCYFWRICGSTVLRCEVPHTGFVEIARAAMVQQFLEARKRVPELRFLVTIDTDEDVGPFAPYQLAQWDKPVVSGIVCSYNEKYGIFACIMLKDKNGIARFPSVNGTGKMPTKGLVKIHRAGAGLLCVRHDVFEAIYAKNDYPFLLRDEDRRASAESGVLKIGEDMYFCQQAQEAGFELYADLAVRARHFKTMALQWPITCNDPTLRCEDWNVSERDFTY